MQCHVALFILTLALVGFPASAHQTGESYVYLNVTDTTLDGRYEIPIKDLQLIFDVDPNRDGRTDAEEFDAKKVEILAHFEKRIGFSIDGKETPISFSASEFMNYGEDWVILSFDVDWAGGQLPDEILVLHESSWQDVDPNHRVLILIESNTNTGLEENEAQHSLIFTTGQESAVLGLVGATKFAAFTAFIWHGIHHLLIGFDHIAFLVALVLPSVLIVRAGKWIPAPSFSSALWNVVKIASVFTLSHSITLTLAAVGFVRLPAAPVEALIAISIVVVAASNIFVVGRRWVYPIVFFLGLLHGLGFANVLAPLAMEPINILPSLIGFNVGIEIGQISILLVPFFLLFMLRKWDGYQTFVLKGGSAILMVVAVYWFAERAMGAISRLLLST